MRTALALLFLCATLTCIAVFGAIIWQGLNFDGNPIPLTEAQGLVALYSLAGALGSLFCAALVARRA